MEYRNAKYINENGWIDCEINHPVHGWIPYTLDPNDEDMQVNNDDLLADMAANNDVAPYVPPTQEELYEKFATVARGDRDWRLVYEVDPVVTNPLRWADLDTLQQDELKAYRQSLLDLTDQPGFPFEITWPTKPSWL